MQRMENCGNETRVSGIIRLMKQQFYFKIGEIIMKNITVREWVNKFNNKEFESKNIAVQCDAGWYDWFCSAARQ